MVARYVKAFKMKACKVQAEMTELLEKTKRAQNQIRMPAKYQQKLFT